MFYRLCVAFSRHTTVCPQKNTLFYLKSDCVASAHLILSEIVLLRFFLLSPEQSFKPGVISLFCLHRTHVKLGGFSLIQEILCWALPLIPAYPLLRRCSSGERPIRTGLFSSALGLVGLAAASILSPVTGALVSINFFTMSVAAILGLPGIVCVTALALI